MNQPRPIHHLNTAMALYPNLPHWVDTFRADRGKSLSKWPDWCFLPMAGWYTVVSDGNQMEVLTLQVAGDVSRLAAMGTWRYSQGIYRLTPELLAALLDSPVSGKLPSDVLYRLPEWCVYVETPGQHWLGEPIHGFWAHLEYDMNTGRSELRFLFDGERSLTGLPVHIGDWTITEAIGRAMGEAKRQQQARGGVFEMKADDIQTASADLNPFISVLLYLCSEEPEIDDARQPGESPNRPSPKKTKKGWRLFPPDKPRVWSVGIRLGAQLRAAQDSQEPGEPTGRTVRPHLRRGHWHGFWLGPRNGERRFEYRWISPLMVGNNPDD